jgi:hypothetical protein
MSVRFLKTGRFTLSEEGSNLVPQRVLSTPWSPIYFANNYISTTSSYHHFAGYFLLPMHNEIAMASSAQSSNSMNRTGEDRLLSIADSCVPTL